MAGDAGKATEPAFVFSRENFRRPALPKDLDVLDVPLEVATDESLKGLGRLIHSLDEVTVERGNFEIVPWPVQGWRQLDPETGDEAGTTEGNFDVHWEGDFYVGTNLAVATANNVYLDGLGAHPDVASTDSKQPAEQIHLWMSDYHPDGAQLFFPTAPEGTPFVVCLGPVAKGDDITPKDMRAFAVPKGAGIYLHPGTWHNGIYALPEHCPARFTTRQGRVHARVSCSWADEFNTVLRVPLRPSA